MDVMYMVCFAGLVESFMCPNLIHHQAANCRCGCERGSSVECSNTRMPEPTRIEANGSDGVEVEKRNAGMNADGLNKQHCKLCVYKLITACFNVLNFL